MARSKDTVLTFNVAVEYLRVPWPATHKLAQDGEIPGPKVGFEMADPLIQRSVESA